MWNKPKKSDGRSTRAVWQPPPRNIKNIKAWPPGAFMVFDNRQSRAVTGGMAEPFVGLGMVVANNGVDRIRVLWGANCARAFLEYVVEQLNPEVIYFLE